MPAVQGANGAAAAVLPLRLRIAVPVLLGLAFVAAWEGLVRYLAVPKYVLPAPSMIATALASDFGPLIGSLWVTLTVTLAAFAAALVLGVLIAILFAQSRLFEISLFPYAVVLQVTPIVSIAPFVLIWVGLDHLERALLILATIVAFFPILSNATLGLKSVDHNLHNLFDLYRATRWQRLKSLQFPGALPYLLGGMRISGGLALIGAVVAEFVAGSGTGTGLAWRIVEAGNRLNIPRMFAALLLLSLLGIVIFFSLSALEYLLLRRWHESAVGREN
ncbi:MAG TPA: ABC transporter permease [Stellaceae bacterium]|jgi:NitT/TauT family transport system permease protein|nr:ABC transporter permease [Stellaceae bacterium]